MKIKDKNFLSILDDLSEGYDVTLTNECNDKAVINYNRFRSNEFEISIFPNSGKPYKVYTILDADDLRFFINEGGWFKPLKINL